MFVKVVYFSFFYCFCFEIDISTDLPEDQVSEERDPDLDEEEDTRMDELRDEHWRDVTEEGKYKKNIHASRWEVYVKDKKELIKREFLVSVPHPKGGYIVCTCVKDHIVGEKEQYGAIGLGEFDYKLF